MTSRKRTVFRTEEALADAVKEIVNDSDSGTDNIPEFSSNEESESESENESDNESNFPIPGPSRRQMLPQIQGFLKMIVNQEYHTSQVIRACNLQLKMKRMC
jgi:hypothetical protein